MRYFILLQTKLKDQTVGSRTAAFADERPSRSRASDETWLSLPRPCRIDASLKMGRLCVVC